MTAPPRPASGAPRLPIRTAQGVLAATFALHALQASAPYGLPALLPFVRSDLGGGYFEAALVSSAFLLGIVAGSPIAGGAVDAFGVRRSIVGGTALATVMLALVPGAPSLWLVCTLLAVAGIGYSVLTPGTNTAMLGWFAHRHRATAAGIKQTGVSAGGIAVASFVPAVSLAWGWQASFHVIALFYAAAFAIAWITLLDGPSGPAPRAARPSLRDAIAAMLGDRPTMLLAADGFLRVGIQYAFLTYLIAYAIDSLHSPVAWGALIYALAHLFGAVGRVGWGWASDRVFHGRRRGPYAAIAITAAAGFALLALAAPLHWAFLLGSVALLGLSAAGFQGVGLSLLAEVGGARAGTASGLVNALSFLGAAVMVPLCGQLLDAGASFATLFGVLAAMSVVTAAITLALPSTTDGAPVVHAAR
ncbi:Hexuronate transporter [Burkholderiales bacterium]|nr:Hexuronate transporter [Burkholderiales bacterium]